MSVTQWARLSETVLQEAITKFYMECKLVPCGVSVKALDQWSAKMAFASRKLTQKFRRIFAETPGNAKSDVIRRLKQRCLDFGIEAPERKDRKSKENLEESDSEEAPSRQASHEDLEAIHPPKSHGFDWKAFGERFRKEQAAKNNCSALDKTREARPVATPARSTHELPPFVVESLSARQTEPAPFPVNAMEEDLVDANDQLSDKAEEPKTKKTAKKKAAAKRKAKKADKVIAGPEEEEALSVLGEKGSRMDLVAETGDGHQKVPNPELTGVDAYEPGKFNEIRKAFIADCRKCGSTYSEANQKWMLSSERATLLQGLPESVLKRRRFA